MERVTNNDFSSLVENKVILDNCDVEMKDSCIQFDGKNNVVYFLGNKSQQTPVILDQCRFQCKGNNNLIFICASPYALKLVITLGHGCNIYVGKNMWNTLPIYLMSNEKSNIIIGEWCLVARDVWMRTSDMHMIYDIESKERINPNEDIIIGQHVWLGQNVTCLKGTVVGSGSLVGLGSVCSNDHTKEVNAMYVGQPAKLVRKGITWRHKGTNQVTEEELKEEKYQKLKDEKFIYDNKDMEASIKKFKEDFHKKDDIDSRIAFFKNSKW